MLKARAEPSVDFAVAELAASELVPACVTPTLPAMASYSAVRASTCGVVQDQTWRSLFNVEWSVCMHDDAQAPQNMLRQMIIALLALTLMP